MENIKEKLNKFILSGKLQLTEAEGKGFLREQGIGVPAGELAHSLGEAKRAAGSIGYPVVLKGELRHITHKSDMGLVRLEVRNEEELCRHYTELANICEGLGGEYAVLVEKRTRFDTELIVALNEDPCFGKVLMFGMGGVLVEVMKDVSFGICPISRRDAYRMIDSLRCSKVFDGVRGRKPADKEKLVELLMALGGDGGVCETLGDEVKTVEINPLVICEDGSVCALDSVVTLKACSERSAVSEPVDMSAMFKPRSIAIVGVSEKPSIAATFMKQSIEAGYAGEIYPVNPKHAGEAIMGRTAYASLRDLPGEVDYVYVAVPARAVLPVIEEAAAKNAKFIHIISGGFAETGAQGRELEKEVLAAARRHGIRLVGPNCMGLVSTAVGLIFTTGVCPERGGVSFISQSGGITTEMLRAGSAKGIHFNQAVSIGNCADLGIEEFLEYMSGDPETKVIGIYSENIRDGALMCRLLKEAGKKKPVVIIKGGRSSEGAKAAASHTGALSSSYALWEAMCLQSGATLVKTLEELMNALLSFQNLKPSADNSVLLVSHSGGVVVSSTDLSEDYGLTLPKLGSEIQSELLSMGLPPGANVSNPMDISLGVMAAKSSEGDNISIIGDIFRHVDKRVKYGYYVFYLMADNVIESGGGKKLIENIFDFAIEWGGKGGEHEGGFVLAANSHTQPEYLAALAKKAAENGATVFPNINEMLQSLGWLSAYGGWRSEN